MTIHYVIKIVYRFSQIKHTTPHLPFCKQHKGIRRIRYNDLVKFHKWIPLSDKSKYNIIAHTPLDLRESQPNINVSALYSADRRIP